MEWRDLPKQQVLPYAGNFCNLGRFLHSACAQGLNDISEGSTVHSYGLYSLRCYGDESSPLHCVYHILRNTIHPHGLYSGRPRNGTQAVPYGFADWCMFEQTYSKNGRPSPNNCQLSIVHCQLGNNCQLSTVNCQLSYVSSSPSSSVVMTSLFSMAVVVSSSLFLKPPMRTISAML